MFLRVVVLHHAGVVASSEQMVLHTCLTQLSGVSVCVVLHHLTIPKVINLSFPSRLVGGREYERVREMKEEGSGGVSSRVECTSEIQSSSTRYGYTLGCVGCEPAVIQVTTWNSAGHESSKPRLQMPTSVHESGKRTKERHVESLMRNQP